MEKRIAEITRSLPWLVCEEEKEIIGYAYASKWKGRCSYRFSVESSIYLKKDFIGTGAGTKLYQRLIEELKNKNLHAVIGGIALPNEKSQRLHEKLGFKKVAHFSEVGFKFGKWIDVGYWELILDTYGVPGNDRYVHHADQRTV
jgi:phosphinothricin acetyltransferase